MKTAFLTLAVALGAWIALPTTAEAGPKFPFPSHFPQLPFTPPGFHHSSIHRGFSGGHGHHGSRCETPYVVKTCEINRYRQCRTAYDRFGRPHKYHVTVVTYRDTYSNGTCRTYTRTY